jgi:hypothetical protein
LLKAQAVQNMRGPDDLKGNVAPIHKTQAEEESALQEIERLRDQGKDVSGKLMSSHIASPASLGYQMDAKSPRSPRSPRPVSEQSSNKDPNDWIGMERGNKPYFDVCTIRTWFMEMDIERSGHVTKQGFMQFIRNRPQLRSLFIKAGQERHKNGGGGGHHEITGKEAEALEIRRLLKLLKEIDADGNGTLEWEEFLDFWRVAGFLLEYETKNNPREQIAEVLGQIHDTMQNGDSDERLSGHLSQLAKEHLSSQSRRKSQDLTNANPEPVPKGYVAVNRRCSADAILQAGRMALNGSRPGTSSMQSGMNMLPGSNLSLVQRAQTARGRRMSDSTVMYKASTLE